MTGLDAAATPRRGRAPRPVLSAHARVWLRLRHDRAAMAALCLIALLVVVAAGAPLVVSLVGAPGPDAQSYRALTSFGTPTGPSARHIFGVDPLGRDVFSRVVYGARVSLAVGFSATAIAMVVGVALGMVAGFFRGIVDTCVSRLIDLFLAFPVLLLALGLAASCDLGHGCAGGLIRPGAVVVVLTIALVSWTQVARVVRGEVLSLRERELVDAARAIGAPSWRILAREILPNLTAPVIVYATLLVPQSILLEAALSYLGVGVQPPTPSWGAMLAGATPVFESAWWYMLFPGLALVLTVLAFNLLGDGLQDALHPQAALAWRRRWRGGAGTARIAATRPADGHR